MEFQSSGNAASFLLIAFFLFFSITPIKTITLPPAGSSPLTGFDSDSNSLEEIEYNCLSCFTLKSSSQSQRRVADLLSRGRPATREARAREGGRANLVIKSDNTMTACKPIRPSPGSRAGGGGGGVMGEWAVIDNARQYISFQWGP